MNTPPDTNSLVTYKESLQAKEAEKQLICQIIATAFSDLKSWGVPAKYYKIHQKTKLAQTVSFEDSPIFDLWVFFIGWDSYPSGIEALAKEFELELPVKTLVSEGKHLLVHAIKIINEVRQQMSKSTLYPPDWETVSQSLEEFKRLK